MMYSSVKRVFDIFSSLLLLAIFSPVFILTAIAIKLDSRGPIFADTPMRVGQDGRLFRMYKFRSMVENAYEILSTDPKYKKLFEEYKKSGFKLKNDPRITRVGHFIRKYSFDEIPQFLNVLKGDMSLVGPRAYYADELNYQQNKYPATKPDVKVVLSVKPGITGLWQVSGRSQINFDKRIKMDAEYASKKSMLYDMWIILKTPEAMLSAKGAL
ncbi:MAG: sugar transferase [Candidatus Levyibacteriota bacterium]